MSRSASAIPRRPIAALAVGMLCAGTVLAGALVASPTDARADSGSAVTVSAAEQDADLATAPMPDLKLTVDQTAGLVSQAVVVRWTGGKQSTQPSQQNGGSNFLQFMQCWGDDPSVPAGQPAQPDRTTCQYGGFNQAGSTRDRYHATGSAAPEDAAYTVTEAPLGDYTSIPFRAVDGTVSSNLEGGKRVPGVDPNTNQFFTKYTTNEVPWAGSGADGTGSIKFEVQTKVQAPGLGCGDILTAADGSKTGRPCWLVAVPRGSSDAGSAQTDQSGLFWSQWKHRLAVRLDFRPVGDVCAIGSMERQLQGSELITGAVASWQPALCAAKGGDAYTVLSSNEADAVNAANGTAPAAMALTSRPLQGDLEDSLKYAPVGLTGLTVSFAIDRQPSLSGGTPQKYLDQSKLPFTEMKLTPRLLAKLLTGSYRDALPYAADRSHLANNPRGLLNDPDFLAINDPEWSFQAIASPAVADALVPQGRSDAAWAVWSYIMSDPEARAFIAGTPDPWGMVVNKWSSDSPNVAPTDAGGQSLAQTYPTDSFPKSDPVEVPAEDGRGPINLVTWRPFTADLDTGAYKTLRGDGQVLGGWNPTGNPPAYDKSVRDLPGNQAVIGLTDAASGAKYLTVSAALRNSAGRFVLPSPDSFTAAAAAMTASRTQPQTYALDNGSPAAAGAPTAYPLTMPVYAAANPAMSDATLRASFAAFIRYAVSDAAQTPGVSIGSLPAGYAPLPAGWRAQARAAADAIQAGVAASPDAPLVDYSGGSSDGGAGFASAGDVSSDGSVPAAPQTPTATGPVAPALSATRTSADPKLRGLGNVVPAAILAGLAGAIAVSVIGRVRRRI